MVDAFLDVAERGNAGQVQEPVRIEGQDDVGNLRGEHLVISIVFT